MAVQHGIWKIGEKPQALKFIKLDSEQLLEQQIFEDISILNENWLLIGRQVYTDYGKYIDLLAIDASGSVIVIELKKHKTPRDVVAQAIDYAAWVEKLQTDRIVKIYQLFAQQYKLPVTSFDKVFEDKFGSTPSEDEVNSSHQMVIVAAELDASTERIINYLNDKASVAINAVFFSVFGDGDNKYLSRSWMIDPGETEDHAINVGQRNEWNGEFYASYGSHEGGRSWADARKYNFISGGGGRWYSKTLFNLNPGDRLWVNIPKTGYVGVAVVSGKAVIADEFISESMELEGSYTRASEDGEDEAEYMVPVRWVYSCNEDKAVSEVGFFGNQNTIAKPRAEKWSHTVERLKELWGV
jgi:hypothetical protein